MRRWNGWGDDTIEYPLPEGATAFLAARVGAGRPAQAVPQETAIAAVPASRLPPHALISTDAAVRLRHACGQSLPDWVAMRSGRFAAFPDGVAYPIHEADVRTLLRYGSETGTCLIPYGGGTSVVGHINPLPGDPPALTIDLSRMNRLIRFDETSQLATFEAGISGPDLEAMLRARGCTLGHFPQSFEYSTLGGWIATRSSGQQSLGYGRIERLFAGGRVESPAGSLVLPPFPASAAGPDLREWFLGSEGRFGILTEATMRVTAVPQREDFHGVFFPAWEQGLAVARAIIQARLPLVMLRLSTPVETETTLALAGHERLIGALERLLAVRGASNGKVMLLIGFAGRDALVKTARHEALDIAGAHGGIHAGTLFGNQWHKSRFKTPYLRNTLWDRGYATDTLETANSWSKIESTVDAIENALHGALSGDGERVHVFTHLSHLYPYGSSIYTTYLFRLGETPEETLDRWGRLKRAASDAIVAQGGTISHQHGVGTDHLPWMEGEKSSLGIDLLRRAGQGFDPHGIMNPGKLIPGAMTDRTQSGGLRYDHEPREADPRPDDG